MIPLPPAELTVVRTPIADRAAFRARIESALETVSFSSQVRPGGRVLIKPSALLLNRVYRPTHLLMLEILIEIIQAGGGNVYVGDSPDAMLQSTRDYWVESGLAHLAGQTRCELFNFEAAKCSAVMVESRAYYLPDALEKFDLIINAAWLGIGLDRNLAGTIQNCLGFLPGRQLEAWDKAIAAVDLYAVVSPHLHLLQFDLKNDSYLVLGQDGLAVDTVVMSRLIGRSRPRCQELAAECGLGIGYEELVEISGAELPGAITPILPLLAPKRATTSIFERIRPINVSKVERIVAAGNCDGCSKCCEVCPTGSISMSQSKFPRWNDSLCIECWRCREHCPLNAIALDATRFDQ